MKTLKTTLALIIGLLPSVKAQQPRPQETRYPSIAEVHSNSIVFTKRLVEYYKTHSEADTRNDIIASVERRVSEYSKTKSPYIKFEGGRVVYLGKLLYEHEGILAPSDTEAGVGAVGLFMKKYKVVHATSNGCHIRFPDAIRRDGKVDRLEMFVQNLIGGTNQVDQDYLVVQYLGNYECRPTPEASHTLPNVTLGKDATKQEYLEFVAKSKKQP